MEKGLEKHNHGGVCVVVRAALADELNVAAGRMDKQQEFPSIGSHSDVAQPSPHISYHQQLSSSLRPVYQARPPHRNHPTASLRATHSTAAMVNTDRVQPWICRRHLRRWHRDHLAMQPKGL
eukprot:scpid59637/ scgid3514/ 